MKYQVKRSKTIKADIKKVRSFVEDFNTWRNWSPWSIIEAKHKGSVKGEAGSVGHSMEWDGEVIGSGINTIESIEDNAINYNLEFLKPFKSKAKTRFEFEKDGENTKVTWLMDGNMPFFLFFMIKSMQSWIEMDYERGLTMLKSMIEDGKVDADTTNEGTNLFKGFSYIGLQRTCKMEDMPKEMTECFETIVAKLKSEGKWAEHWISVYPKVNMKTKEFTFIAAVSTEELEGVEFDNNFVRGKLNEQPMFEIKHRGSYQYLGNAWSMGMMYLRAKKMKQNGKPFEYYWNSPKDTEPNKLETSIYFPVK